jgi:hypothetical protein
MSALSVDTLTALRNLGAYLAGVGDPTIRLGVTGLSRSGKTVFITALVHALLAQSRLPLFRAMADGRIRSVTLAEQPDDAVPRFPVEDHLATLTAENRAWPESTRRISEVRVIITYESKEGLFAGERKLTLDIVDYPGEWLLDLPLLDKSYATWSRETLDLARVPPRAGLAGRFLAAVTEADPAAAAEEATARALAEAFTAFLRACRTEAVSLSALPPGRFLMPGDLEGSPALTFAPLPPGDDAPSGSLRAMMERRFEAYKQHVVRPFFRDHFARLDRQIVLVDTLFALNAGAAAVADLEAALAEVLTAFRTGRNSWLSTIFAPKIDRIVFAATKADHLHHINHDRLEAITRRIVERAARRAEGGGAAIDVVALAAVRATREVSVKEGRSVLPSIAGVPAAGERLDGRTFDGLTEVALFPGDLPDDADRLFAPGFEGLDLSFLRFRPPMALRGADGRHQPLPHIRLDRALEFLIGDRLG